MKFLCCVLDALRRYKCDKAASAGVPALSFSGVFQMLSGSATTACARVYALSFCSVFTRFEAIPVSACLKCVLDNSRRYHCDKVGSTRVLA